MDASFFFRMMSILEQEPRLHDVLLIVSSNQEFDEWFSHESFRICFNNSKRFGDEWSSYKELTADTLAHRGDEGRGYLR